MQKLTVSRLVKNKRYGNWSGTGAGKTNAFIISSREINSKLTLVIALNSTISQLGGNIKDVYPDSVIHYHYSKGQVFDTSKHNYLLLNYEKFQQGYSEEMFQDLNKNNKIDFIVLDEIHNAKQRDPEKESARRGVLMRLIGRSDKDNTNFHLLGMSATPVINNLIEAKSLLHMVTGDEYSDLTTRSTLSNAMEVFKHLTLNGIRYKPKYKITLNEKTGENTPYLKVDGTHLLDGLLSLRNSQYVPLEHMLLESKLNAVRRDLAKGTIIYSNYTNDGRIPSEIASYVEKLGFSCGYYTGDIDGDERKDSLDKFINGEVDILISTGPITTGVDGLQKVSNKIIIISLPWTDAIYTQLKGRLQRTGSNFNHVDIIIPQVYINYEGEEWSWDLQRINVIRNKRTIADAAVDGVIPSNSILTATKLCAEALKSLKSIKERINEGNHVLVNRSELKFPLNPEIIEYLKPKLGDFSEMNKKWSVSSSKTTHDRLKTDPSEWHYYHTLYSERRISWSEIPFVEIGKKINPRPEWVVGDFGCGENLLSKEISNKVYGFDHVAIDDEVIACDIKNVPIEDEVLDVAVFSLSLMGTNYVDYFKEAYRTLKTYGNIFVCEPAAKWEGKEEKLKEHLESVGFRCFGAIKNTSKFIYIDGIKY